jgi:capsular polysaccharide biosynthesis protein
MSDLLTLPYETETAYAERTNLRRRTLYPAEQVECGATMMFPSSPDSFYEVGPRSYEFPAVTLTEMHDVVVRGGSNILTTRDAIVRHDLIALDRDVTPEEFYGWLGMTPDRKIAAWRPRDPFEVDYLPEAAVFTDRVAVNYAHWLTEVLPRIAAFAKLPGVAGVPLVVDDNLHPNMYRSIALAAPESPVRRLGRRHALRIGRAHNVSPTGYVQFMLRGALRENYHGAFSQGALTDMVARLRQAAGAELPQGRTGRKLFIRRQTRVRRMVTEPQIAELLTQLGFEMVQPELLSFDEQVRTFSSASLVVCSAGAAATNLLFCPPGCPVVMLIPRLRHVSYWYWRSMAPHVALVHANGPQLKSHEDPFHPEANDSDYRIELKDVLQAVAAAEALRS